LHQFFACGPLANWVALLALTIAFSAVLSALQLPAALLLAAIVAAAIFSAREGRVHLPAFALVFAQAVIGGMIGRVLNGAVFIGIVHGGPLILVAAASVILASCGLGLILARARIFPAATAVWGSLPGAATAMTLIAEAHGADMRLVAFMQYARVLVVALAASLFAKIFAPGAFASAANPLNGAAPWSFEGAGLTCLLLVAAAETGRRLRLPAGALLGPLFGAALAQNFGFSAQLPAPVLAIAYVALGWSIGLHFTRKLLLHVFRALPAALGAILALLACCGALGFVLARVAGIDQMTAFLAMSPGGLDAVAIIAASAKLDLGFIMAVQMARFLLILAFGPRLASLFARLAGAKEVTSGRGAKNWSQDPLD
jgi:membrane AbrB-like protein